MVIILARMKKMDWFVQLDIEKPKVSSRQCSAADKSSKIILSYIRIRFRQDSQFQGTFSPLAATG